MADSKTNKKPTVKKEIRRPLKPREYRFLKTKIDNPDMPNYKAAMIATNATTVASANVEAKRMLQNASLREKLDEALVAQGFTMDNITKPVKRALNYQGETERDTIDVQLKAHDRALKMLQIIGGEQGGGNNTFIFNNGDSSQNFIKK